MGDREEFRDKYKEILSNPYVINTALGGVLGVASAAQNQASAIEDVITTQQQQSRHLLPLDKVMKRKFVSGNPEEIVEKLKKVNPKVLPVDVDQFDAVYHSKGNILELIPKRDYIKSFMDSSKGAFMRDALKSGKGLIAANALAGLGIAGAMDKGPEVWDVIKRKFADTEGVKKASKALKEELEKRAKDESLNEIINSVDINEIISRNRRQA